MVKTMLRILIADDESFEREILEGIIKERFSGEAQIRTAENGRQALDTAALWSADIILMDIEMPGIDGIEASKKIVGQCPACRIIFVTAYSLFSYAHEAVRLGACDYILKPVDADDVERAIRKAAKQVEAQHQLEAMAPDAALLEDAGSFDKATVLMGQVKKYLKHNYMMCDISLDSVSAILGINSSYFSVLFKRALGVNFVDYLTELRMNAAKELLLDPLRSAAEIAGMVGYDSANYFTRAFKKRVGMTPTEFRRSALSGRGRS